jgi:uncharacterized protein YjiK
MACVDNSVKPRNEAEEDGVEVFQTSVPEPSDLCLNFSGNGLFVVSDQGSLYEIGFDGKTIRKLTQYKNPDASAKKDDLEGVCIDPVAKNIFVVNERTLRVSRLDENGKHLDNFVIPASVLKPKAENSGVEGITLYDDVFYFVNQDEPRVLLTYNRRTQTWSQQIPLNFCLDVNAVSYDATDHTLWILSVMSKKLFQCTTAGVPLKVLDVSFITQPEGVCVDRTNNAAYICCDNSGKLYKVSLSKLSNYE